MARRRKRSSRRKKGIRLEVKKSVLQEIWAVIYLALFVFTFLSLSSNFGLIGDIWIGVLKPILGVGVYVLPYFFLGIALLLFFSKKIVFPLSRLMGIFFLAVSILSIMHLYVPMEAIHSEAQQGKFGGYVGFVANFLFRQVLGMGHLGGAAVFITMFLIGILLTFEISLGKFFSFLKPEIKIVRKKAAQSKKQQEEEYAEEEYEEEEEEDDEYEEEEELTDDEMEEERVRLMREDRGEIVTIKRPVVTEKSTQPVTKMIQINEEDAASAGALRSEDEEFPWEPPGLDLLHPSVADIALDDGLLQENAKKIRSKLKQFGLAVEMHEVHVGPTVIQYTLRPSEGIKLSKITSLKNDLALALAAKAVRIEAPIPGKSLVGVEVPNDHRSIVHLRELLESKEYEEIDSNLRLPLGRDVSGRPVCGDLTQMPHLLIAGATGAGKSVGMNAFILSLIYQNSPADLKFIMIDPKRVELNTYNGIPHLITPVITDPEKAAIALRWLVAEMNKRYQLFSEKRFRNITEYNDAVKKEQATVPQEGDDEEPLQKMPNIVVIIDELADLMMAAGKEVEASICRVAQMARAVGIHLIVATQRPSVDVITGLIKANIPSRIAFAVSSAVDSRTILDGIGAEDLLGKGDMLYLPGGMSKPQRIQGIFVSSQEIEKVTAHVKMTAPPSYMDDIISSKVVKQKVQGIPESKFGEATDDDLYEQALQVILETRKASASLLQRRLKVGYARAARLLDLMEENGVIGPVNGAKPRDIYVD